MNASLEQHDADSKTFCLWAAAKFSALPVLIQAARMASGEANGVGPEADARKRLLVVGSCHVQELVTETQADNWVRVTGVRVIAPGGIAHVIPLASPVGNRQSVVILATGTIESTRVALTTFQQSLSGRAAQRMGKNLIAHLRSNLTLRVHRGAIMGLLGGAASALQASALFVKGKAKINGTDRFFHIQITASGLGKLGDGPEAELFKKILDMDAVQAMLNASDTHVVITLRGIGEMSPHNPDSTVVLSSPPPLDFDRPRA